MDRVIVRQFYIECIYALEFIGIVRLECDVYADDLKPSSVIADGCSTGSTEQVQ